MAATADDASRAVTALTDAAWALAAVVEVIERGPQPSYAADDLPARVLAQVGLVIETDGGLVPTPGFADFVAQSGPIRAAAARSVMGQVASLLAGGNLAEGWTRQDDETLKAQGAASAGGIDFILAGLFAQLPGLEERLRAEGAAFLDVGAGVGAMACAWAEAIPTLTIVGVDPFERVHRMASELATARGLGDRVTFRLCGVEDLGDVDAFDLAWIPAPFVPPGPFRAGLATLHRAIRPDGWIVVGMGRLEGEDLSSAVTRWQTALIGGTPLTPAEAASLLTAAGFADPRTLATPPGAPVLVAARRP